MIENKLIKQGIWAYFFLLIFEGALRKWIVPGLATPLLVIRDPIALGVIFMVWRQGEFPRSIYLGIILSIGILGICTAMIFGHGNLPVAIYGARILLIHFPFMYAMGKVLDRDDVLRMGKILLWISIPMVILIALQFYSSQSAWVNRGVGGDEDGAGFSGALGYFRPPGTFSFTNGNSLFFSIVTCFVIYFWLNPSMNRIVLVLSSIAVISSIPLSISRSLFFTVGVAIVFALLGVSRNPRHINKIFLAGIIVALGVVILSRLNFFQTATNAFTSRFENANNAEGGLHGVLVDRYLGGLVGALKSSAEQPFFGYGIGMGTNVGSQLLAGKQTFLIAEGEWARLIGELGPLMGLGVISVRLAICMRFLTHAYRKLAVSDLLPWMLLSFGLLIIPQGQWAQPTALGFSTLIGGLLFASFRNPVTLKIEKPIDYIDPNLS